MNGMPASTEAAPLPSKSTLTQMRVSKVSRVISARLGVMGCRTDIGVCQVAASACGAPARMAHYRAPRPPGAPACRLSVYAADAAVVFRPPVQGHRWTAELVEQRAAERDASGHGFRLACRQRQRRFGHPLFALEHVARR